MTTKYKTADWSTGLDSEVLLRHLFGMSFVDLVGYLDEKYGFKTHEDEVARRFSRTAY